jgi:hypothetical protein
MGLYSEYCLCHVHVNTAAKLIAVHSIILAVISAAAIIVQICLFEKWEEVRYNAWFAAFRNLNYYFHHYWILGVQLGLACILLILSILLLYGRHIRNRYLYFPFILFGVS